MLTGFLGSGKTTLLRETLARGTLGSTAVLVNEYGLAGLDHHQLAFVTERVALLPGGCLCCAVRDDLTEALLALLDAEAAGAPRCARVVVETTGLADPAPVLATLDRHPTLRHQFGVDHVVVTVDAEHGARQAATQDEWVRQVSAADVIVTTKADLASPRAQATLVRLLDQVNPAASRIGRERLDSVLLGRSAPRDRSAEGYPPGPRQVGSAPGSGARPARDPDGHLRGVTSAVLPLGPATDADALVVWLTALLCAHGEQVLRIKAVVHVDGIAVVLDAVGHTLYPPTHLPAVTAAGQLVVICRDLPASEVVAALAHFLATGPGTAT